MKWVLKLCIFHGFSSFGCGISFSQNWNYLSVSVLVLVLVSVSAKKKNDFFGQFRLKWKEKHFGHTLAQLGGLSKFIKCIALVEPIIYTELVLRPGGQWGWLRHPEKSDGFINNLINLAKNKAIKNLSNHTKLAIVLYKQSYCLYFNFRRKIEGFYYIKSSSKIKYFCCGKCRENASKNMFIFLY